MKTIEAVKCENCGKLHEVSSEDFISIHGNVCIGMNGGIIGHNFDKEGRVNRISVYCINNCLKIMLEKFTTYTKR